MIRDLASKSRWSRVKSLPWHWFRTTPRMGGNPYFADTATNTKLPRILQTEWRQHRGCKQTWNACRRHHSPGYPRCQVSSEPFWSQIWWSKQWLQIQCRAGAIFCWTWIGYTKTRSNASKQVVLVQKAPQRKHMFFLRAMLGVQIRGPSPCWGNIISSWFLVPSMACPRKYSYVRWVWGDLVIECFFSNDSPPLVA